jgi:hypothetical protein
MAHPAGAPRFERMFPKAGAARTEVPEAPPLLVLALNAGGHGGEAIPVPIPNTEVKLSYADDTGVSPGK